MRRRSLSRVLVAVTALVAGVTMADPVQAEPTLVSELTFPVGDPTFDPFGDGTSIKGDVTVVDDGWLDFAGRAVVETPDRASLNPGTASFVFGARIALTRGAQSSVIMQKGDLLDHQWRLSLIEGAGGARVSCRVSGSLGAVRVVTEESVIPVDGSWRQVTCSRSGGRLHVAVDGQSVANGSGTIGAVSSTDSYLIGSLGTDAVAAPEQYAGLLDDAFVQVDTGESEPPPPPPLASTATATVETEPVSHTGDAADDPAIWPHPTDPGQSLIIGNDKGGSLDVYDMRGQLVQRINEGFFGNVDVRTAVTTGGVTRDLVAVYRSGLRLYAVNPSTRTLENVTDATTGSIPVPTGGEGLCFYRSPVTSTHYVYVISRSGNVAQYRLQDADGDGLVDATRVRLWTMGSEAEGCVADDELGRFYIAEEDVALWRYGAEPQDGTSSADRVAVDRVSSAGGRLAPDIEGLTLVDTGQGQGFLLASAQAASDSNNFYAVYGRTGGNDFVRTFRVGAGTLTDGCGRTDGITALAQDLGPAFPRGAFICQDNTNTSPGTVGNQNFKVVPLERVVTLDDPVNRPPTAIQATPTCDALTCTFDAMATFDPEGGAVELTWLFGDGTGATGPTATHAYPQPGQYTVTLIARDEQGAESIAIRTITVTDISSAIAFHGATGTNNNSTSLSPRIPSSAVAGDTLILVVSANRSTVPLTPPSGWQLVGTQLDESMQTRVWLRTAGPADAGSSVRVTTSTTTKLVGQVLAYGGTDAVTPVSAYASSPQSSFSAAHQTPVVDSTPDAWVVSVWANKSSATTGWTAPAEVSVRDYRDNNGSGRITSLVADSNGPVGATTAGGLTAVASQAGSMATTWTIVLRPG